MYIILIFPFLPNIYLSILDWLLFFEFIFKWSVFSTEQRSVEMITHHPGGCP